jgi:hypothetical protein
MNEAGARGVAMVRRVLGRRRSGVRLPYGPDCPIVYDKDAVSNCYTDDYVMALASTGAIRLRGMLTSSSVAPFNPWVPEEDYEGFVEHRRHAIEVARSSGLRHLPDPVRGTKGHLVRPGSGSIGDTEPLGSEGSFLIVRETQSADPATPVLVLAAGPLTVVADACLLDPSITDRLVVAWFGGRLDDMGDYNGWADPWAAYIVVKSCRLVQFPAKLKGGKFQQSPVVPKNRLEELPPSPLRDWMIGKRHPNLESTDTDPDAPPAISVVRPDYVKSIRPVSVAGWTAVNGREVPSFVPDPVGRTLVVTKASQAVATEEWWRALRDPGAYHATGRLPRERLES